MIRYARGWVKYETTNPRCLVNQATGEYESLGSQLRRTGRSERIEDYEPDAEFNYLVDKFWECKGYAGDVDTPLQHCHFAETLLDRNERAIILATDRAFRSALIDERAKNDKYMSRQRK